MKHSYKINQLRKYLEESLLPMIDADYVLLDLPYYYNVGDILIWEGTEALLSKVSHACVGKASADTFTFPELKPDTIILLQGGGNFGDLYYRHQKFRLSVIQRYPKNRIIVLPQTVYYNSPQIASKDAAIMRQHEHLTICARDTFSYKFLRDFRFSDNIMMLPDMAFCIDCQKLSAMIPDDSNAHGKTLVFKRLDCELADSEELSALVETKEHDVHDWETVEHPNSKWEQDLVKMLYNNPSPDFNAVNEYAESVLKPELIESGVGLIGRYSKVYTTRLHAAILAILLGKEVRILDNSYGKLSNYFETWIYTEELPQTKPEHEYKYDLSVIVPVYNVRDYVEKCILSITEQTYNGSIECIIVDDCGTDDSIDIVNKIAESYKGKDNRVFNFIRHKQNRGLSAARNTGIMAANGKYIMFLDSDDYMEKDAVSKMIDTLQKNNADFVVGDIQLEGPKQEEWNFAKPGVYTDQTLRLALRFEIYPMAWNKIMSREFIINNRLFFIEGLCHEDLVWHVQVACASQRFVFLEDKTYHYVIRSGSLKTKDSYEFHTTHLAQGQLYLLDFIMNDDPCGNKTGGSLRKNRLLHDYTMNKMDGFLLEPCKKGSAHLSRAFYHEFRQRQFWTKNEIKEFCGNQRERKLLYSRSMPELMGWWYYRLFHKL